MTLAFGSRGLGRFLTWLGDSGLQNYVEYCMIFRIYLLERKNLKVYCNFLLFFRSKVDFHDFVKLSNHAIDLMVVRLVYSTPRYYGDPGSGPNQWFFHFVY